MNDYERDGLYWDTLLALAAYDPHQQAHQTTVETCFYPGIIPPGRTLQRVVEERRRPLGDIVATSERALATIPGDAPYGDFRRAAWHGVRIHALRFLGSDVPLKDEVTLAYGLPEIHVVPDEAISETNRRISDLLPGEGTATDRLNAYLDHFRVPRFAADQQWASAIVDGMVRTTRDMTAERLDAGLLPSLDHLDVRQSYHSARFMYNGPGEKSMFEYVTAFGGKLTPLPNILQMTMHELWPGHYYHMSGHVARGARDQFGMVSGFSPTSPYAGICEGMALNARRVLMTDDEFADTMARLYAGLGEPTADGTPAGHVTEKDVRDFLALTDLRQQTVDARDNALIFLLYEGRPEADVKQYLQDFLLLTPQQAEAGISHMKQTRGYGLVYNTAQKLYRRWLESHGDIAQQRLAYVDLCKDIVMPGRLRAQ